MNEKIIAKSAEYLSQPVDNRGSIFQPKRKLSHEINKTLTCN
jgi:hypothetical protein